MRSRFFLVLVLLLVASNAAVAQTTAFTYQGKLADNGNPANGHYDFQFTLFDALSGGAQQGTPQTSANILVTNGIFAVTLDFVNCSGCSCPTCFNGGPRFLAIAVRPTGGGSYTPLTDRQPITSTPYAVKSTSAANATTADGLSVACVSCVTSSQILSVNGSAVTGTIPVASVPDLGASYIKNTTSPQSSSNFNISGNGTASILEATTQFNLAGSRILSTTGGNNLFVGVSAGASNTGSNNSFFGSFAGSNNAGGNSDSFFGRFAGGNNTGGTFNSFFGRNAGLNNTGGSNNTILGAQAGLSNTTEDSNTFIGFFSNGLGGITNATAIGAAAQVTQSNSLVLGQINGVNSATADTKVGIGTTAPAERLHVVGNALVTGNVTGGGTLSAATVNTSGFFSIGGLRVLGVNGPYNDGTIIYTASNTFTGDGAGLNTTPDPQFLYLGKLNSFFGAGAGKANTTGYANSFFGAGAGEKNIDGVANSFFGKLAGSKNTSGSNNSFFGIGAGQENIDGVANSFFGEFAGVANTSGSNNSSFGVNAGNSNTTGGNNSFFGVNAGTTNHGSNNSFFGVSANFNIDNAMASDNTLLGYASMVAGNFDNQTAIGSRATVTQSNSLVLGSINGINGATASTSVGIGTTAPTFKLQVEDPSNAGLRVATNTGGGKVASFGGAGKFHIDSNGTDGGRLTVLENGNVGIGNPNPADKLNVNGNISLLLASGGTTSVCQNGSAQISTCGSSIRYKHNISPFAFGLSLINRLRPVSFEWKANNQADMGLIAEEVAKVEPLLVTHNDRGEIEGVKYDRVGVVLINAIKEQQAQITDQQSQIDRQAKRIHSLEQQADQLQKLVHELTDVIRNSIAKRDVLQ